MSTPFASHFRLSAVLALQSEDEQFMSRVLYSNTIGSIMYDMMCTRPDISQAISVVRDYMATGHYKFWLGL